MWIIALLFKLKDSREVLYIETIVNFTLLSCNIYYNEEIIRCMEDYLNVFNRAKEALRSYFRSGYFVFPEIHIQIYYIDYIRN